MWPSAKQGWARSMALNEVPTMSSERLQHLGEAALATARKGKRLEVLEALIAYTNWIHEQAATGARRPHRATKDKPRCDTEVRRASKSARNMVEHMGFKGEVWAAKWAPSTSRSSVLELLAVVREAAREEPWEPIKQDSIEWAINHMAPSKAKGVEQMGALCFKWLPKGG